MSAITDNSTKKVFGSRLKELRKMKGLTQIQLAHLLFPHTKLDDSSLVRKISGWETGKSLPKSFEVIFSLCSIIDCDVDYLIGRIDDVTHDVATIANATGLSSKVVEQLVSDQKRIDKDLSGLVAFGPFDESDVFYDFTEKTLLIDSLYSNDELLSAILKYIRVSYMTSKSELSEKYGINVTKEIAKQAYLRAIGNSLDAMTDPVPKQAFSVNRIPG